MISPALVQEKDELPEDTPEEEPYRRIERDFDVRLDSAVDVKSDFAEHLELVEALTGVKPSFFAFVSTPERIGLYQAIAGALDELGTIPGLRWGWDRADVHVRHRDLDLPIPGLAAVVATKGLSSATKARAAGVSARSAPTR